MSHIELPCNEGGHVTLVHFPGRLTEAQGNMVLEGLEKIGPMGIDLELRWTEKVMMGKYNNVKAWLIDDAWDVLHNMRERLVRGLASRGIAYSDDYAKWTPHVSNGHPGEVPWSRIDHAKKLVLVQKPHRIEVPFMQFEQQPATRQPEF